MIGQDRWSVSVIHAWMDFGPVWPQDSKTYETRRLMYRWTAEIEEAMETKAFEIFRVDLYDYGTTVPN